MEMFFKLAFASILMAASAPSMTPVPVPEAAPTPYFINLGLVPLVKCDNHRGSGIVAGSGYTITASHVIGDKLKCTLFDEPVEIIFKDDKGDYAVLGSKPTYQRNIFNCGGFKQGATYYSVGWAGGQELVVQKLIGTSSKTVDGLAILKGSMFAGMSGGPILDVDGLVVGINSAILANGRPLAFSRELKDTYFCKK